MRSPFPPTRQLRPAVKALPEATRRHNRALVLQTLLHADGLSRADVARETGLTRVTVSDLVSELLTDGLVNETGPREDSRPGKPATQLEVDTSWRYVIGLDLSDHQTFRGALLRIDGTVVARDERELDGQRGAAAYEVVVALVDDLTALADRPLLGIGIGSPGVVDLAGTVLSAPNLGWNDLPLQHLLATRSNDATRGVDVVVINDANAAVLAEHSFGGASPDLMVVRIEHGVGSGLVIGGVPVHGSRAAAGEIGHVTVGTDGGPECVCGKHGCLEAWLAAPRLEQAIAEAADDAAREAVLVRAGTRLGIAIAPIVGALDLAEIVLSGPEELLAGPLLTATSATLRERTMPAFHADVVVRLSALGDDIVVRGAAAAVVTATLGVA